MQQTKKGASKILLLAVIIVITVISAMMFGYAGENVDDAENEAIDKVQGMGSQAVDKVQGVIEQKGEEMVDKVIDEGQEVIGKKLKETGERMLEESNDPGYYGEYGDDGIDDYENVILFFTTEWCPSCVDAQKDIEDNENKIPSNVAIVRVDFDEEKELCQQHGIAQQHTFVLLGGEDHDDKKWQGSKTLWEIIDNIK
ncbi:MAG: thioredoxin family protein [Patescibacteria group bacterium]